MSVLLKLAQTALNFQIKGEIMRDKNDMAILTVSDLSFLKDGGKVRLKFLLQKDIDTH